MLPPRVKTDKRHEKAFNFTCSSPVLCIIWRCHQNVNQNLLTSCNAESVMRKFSKPDSTLQNHKQGHIIVCVLECKSEIYTFHFNLVYICWIFLLVVFIYFYLAHLGRCKFESGLSWSLINIRTSALFSPLFEHNSTSALNLDCNR